MTISLRPNDVRTRLPQGLIGAPVNSDFLAKLLTVVNSNPQAKQVSTIVVNTATASYAYITTINDCEITFTAPASGNTTSTVATGIAAAIEAEPLVGGQVRVTVDTATITITGAHSGTAFTIASADDGAKTTVATSTAAATADAVPFGRAVVMTDFNTPEAERLGGLAKSSIFTAQADSYAVTYENTIVLNAEIVVDGIAYLGSVTMGTSLDASLDALVVVLNGAATGLPANTVIATATPATATALVLTSEVAGKSFTSRVWLGVGATVAAPVKTTNWGPETDFALAFLGVSRHSYDEEVTTVGGTSVSYPANAGVKVLVDSEVWVSNTQSPGYGDAVYVELGASNSGMFYTTTSATRVLLPRSRARWMRYAAEPTDGIAVLSLSAG